MKKIFIGITFLFLVFLFGVNTASAATPIVQASSTAYAFTGTSLSWALDIQAVDSSIIVFARTTRTDQQVTSCTVNGVVVNAGGGGAAIPATILGWWYFTTSTSTGNHNMICNFSGTTSNWWTTAIEISGTDTTGNPTSASSTKSFPAATDVNWQINGTVDELLIDNLVVIGADAEIVSIGTDQTLYAWDRLEGLSPAMTTGKTATTTGESSLSEIFDTSSSIYAIVLSIKEEAAAAASPPGRDTDVKYFNQLEKAILNDELVIYRRIKKVLGIFV